MITGPTRIQAERNAKHMEAGILGETKLAMKVLEQKPSPTIKP